MKGSCGGSRPVNPPRSHHPTSEPTQGQSQVAPLSGSWPSRSGSNRTLPRRARGDVAGFLNRAQLREFALVVGTEIPLPSVSPAQRLCVGPDASGQGELGSGTSLHRHADLPTALVAHHHVALDGHTRQVYSDRTGCQAIRGVILPGKGLFRAVPAPGPLVDAAERAISFGTTSASRTQRVAE